MSKSKPCQSHVTISDMEIADTSESDTTFKTHFTSIWTKYGRLITILGITVCIMEIPLIITFIITQERINTLVKKLKDYREDIYKLKGNLNETSTQLLNTSSTLDHVLTDFDELIELVGQYRKISDFGHFYRLPKLMNYHDGQTACEKVHGHILEFDERFSNYKDKLRALRQEYGKHKFYVGLTDIEEENVWKWTSSGRILSLANNPWDDGEPNNLNSEDCALVQGVNLFLVDVKCSVRSYIICEKSDTFQ